ncbi:MAG: hypothetical protein JW880_05200 [Candidatus Thermoplasmatota archaeon]|nr:hypothetical protein [Candidatus Thermoplasmatota archaeon]
MNSEQLDSEQLVNPKFSEYLKNINSALFDKFGSSVNGDIDYLDAIMVFAGLELAHAPDMLRDSEIVRLVRAGEVMGRFINGELSKESAKELLGKLERLKYASVKQRLLRVIRKGKEVE